MGSYQQLAYQAPEVLLDYPNRDESIDMWSMGCTLAVLYLGKKLSTSINEYEAMRIIFQMNGKPSNDILDNSRKTTTFFHQYQGDGGHSWIFKTPEQYIKSTGH